MHAVNKTALEDFFLAVAIAAAVFLGDMIFRAIA